MIMKRIFSLVAGIPLIAAAALLLASCSKQCACHKVTHYVNYSTNQDYNETVSSESSCSSLDGEFFHEDAYGNTISVDVVSCHEI